MRRSIFTGLILLLCTSCACVAKPSKAPYDTVHAGKGVEVRLFAKGPYSAYPWYDILVRFSHTTEYTHLVQEIEFEGGWRLVECFRVYKGLTVIDHHSGTGWRRMRVYPADVIGAAEIDGFAHLSHNIDGSFVTKIPPALNRSYCKRCGDGNWPGVIVRTCPPEHAATWRITPDYDNDPRRMTEVWLPVEGAVTTP